MRNWKGAFAALFVCSWAGNQFSPLLLMYQEVRGYPTVVVNAFLGVYVLGLAPSLLLAGPLSDRYGRRPVMLAGALSALATSIILALGTLGPLPIYLGRLLAGITVGTAMAVGTSWLKELSQPPYDLRADPGAGARRASLAFTLGSGLGALVAGGLAQWGPAPTILPYLPHLAFAAPLIAILGGVPETRNPDRTTAFRNQTHIPSALHPRFGRVVAIAAPWIFAAAALSYGYVPVLLREPTQGWGVAYATLLTVVALGVAAIVQPAAKRLDSTRSARGLATALGTLTASTGVIALVVLTKSPLLGLAAAALAGLGIGLALTTGLLEVQRIAQGRDLAGLTGLFYALAYLGFLLPTGMAAITPPLTTLQLLAAATALSLLGVALVTAGSRKNLPTQNP